MRIWVCGMLLAGAVLAEDPGTRAQAAAFVSLLPDEALRPVAEQALERLGEDAVPALAAALADAGFGARGEVIVLLGKAGKESDAAKDALRRATRDRDAAVRVAVCAVLLDLGEPADGLAAPLASALASEDEQVRRAAAAGLSKAGIAIVDALDRGTRSESPIERTSAATRLGAMGRDAKQAVPRLVEMLSDKEEGVRVEAASALKAMGADAAPAASRLREILSDPATRPALRSASFAALDAIRPQGWDATRQLMELFAGPDAPARAFAAAELGRRRVAAAAPGFVLGLNDMSHLVRNECALALARVSPDSPETLVVLVAALEDRFLVSPAAAATALGETASKAAKPALEEAAQSEDEALAAAARSAIERIG